MKFKKYRHRYNKLSNRLIFSISIAVVLCFTFFTYNVSTSIAKSEFQRFEQSTDMLSTYINYEMNTLIQQIDSANQYYELALMEAKSPEIESDCIEKGLNLYDQYINGVFVVKSPTTNNHVQYYKFNENNRLSTEEPLFNIATIKQQYKNMDNYTTQFFYFDDTTKNIFAIKRLYQANSQNEILLGIEINQKILNQYVNGEHSNTLGNIGITSADGTIMFHSNTHLVGKFINDLSIGNEIADNLSRAIIEKQRFRQTVNSCLDEIEMVSSEEHTFMYIPIALEDYGTSWGIIVDISDNILKESSILTAKTIIIGGILILIALIMVIKFIVRRGLQPIDDIMDVMTDVETGNLDARTSIKSCNEMEVIGRRLNGLLDHMIEDRDSLVKQKNEIEDLLIEVENLMQENDRVYFETIKSLAKTIDAKDQYTGGHCDRVTEYSLFIGQQMQFSQEELSSLTYGAMLHDIGKIGVPESIITKEGRLTDEEYEAMKTHPEKGYDILKDINFLKDARLGVLHHHERYDGKGYPHGLAGENIDLKARIISIADAFDAMTSNRSYRNALSIEAAKDQLIINKGRQFDPQMVDILVKGIENKQIATE